MVNALKNKSQYTKQLLTQACLLFMVIIYLLINTAPAYAITTLNKKAILNNTVWYNECDASQESSGSDTENTKKAYFIGDSKGYFLETQGGVEQKFEDVGWELTRNSVPGRSYTSPGGQLPEPGAPAPQSVADAILADNETIREADAIIIELGTNPPGEVETSFATRLTETVNALKAINSTADYYYIDIGATANPDEYQRRNRIIYDNKETLGYEIISEYKNNFGARTDPRSIPGPRTLNPPDGRTDTSPPADTNDYLLPDFIHHTDAGAKSLARLIRRQVTGLQAPREGRIEEDLCQTSTEGSDECFGLTAPAIADQAKLAASIDSYMNDNAPAGSPLRGLGDKFVSGAVSADINPLLVVAHAQKESSFGTAGIATRGTFNAFGRTATSSQPNVDLSGRLWYKYDSWEKSLDGGGEDDQPGYMRRKYIEELGITTLDAYINVYAPPSENDTAAYIQQVRDIMQAIVDVDPSALNCGAQGGTPEENKELGRQMAAERGWTGNEWNCLLELWTQESGWSQFAINDAEGNNDLNNNSRLDIPGEDITEQEDDAYGIPQSKPGGKMATKGTDWKTNPTTQIAWGLDYIAGRYSTPTGTGCNAPY